MQNLNRPKTTTLYARSTCYWRILDCQSYIFRWRYIIENIQSRKLFHITKISHVTQIRDWSEWGVEYA